MTGLADLVPTARVRRAAATSKDVAPEIKARPRDLAAPARVAKAVPAPVVRLDLVLKAARAARLVRATESVRIRDRVMNRDLLTRGRVTGRVLRIADRSRDLRRDLAAPARAVKAAPARVVRLDLAMASVRIRDRVTNKDLRTAAARWVRLLVVLEIAVLKDAPDSGRVRTVARWVLLPSRETSAVRSDPVSAAPARDAELRKSSVAWTRSNARSTAFSKN